MVDENNTTWIDNNIISDNQYPNAPMAQVGLTFKKMLERGFDKKEINDFVRAIQYKALFGVCAFLDGCYGESNFRIYAEDAETGQMLFLNSLHEDFLSLDPTGREMRPRKD